MVVWQAVALSAVLSALAAGPTAVRTTPEWSAAAVAAWTVTALIGVRLAVTGHRVGTRLRTAPRGTPPARRPHRPRRPAPGADAKLRVLAHPTPTAYCLPRLRRRVVLSKGTLSTLPPDQLAAVLAHERAHGRARHDLVLEYFTVLHEAAPASVRAPEALDEVRLLIEVLADRVARRAVGEVSLARALVSLAGGAHPGESRHRRP